MASTQARAPGSFVFLDADAVLQPQFAREGLARNFGAMARHNATLGLSIAPTCLPPGHKLPGIPRSFCERNGGVIFARPGAARVLAAWRREFEGLRSSDGHDQQSLRKVLWDHRGDGVLYDLPPHCNCRHCQKPKADRMPCFVHHNKAKCKRIVVGH